MSEQTAEAAATETEAPATTDQAEQKPTETVDFWKQKAREQEKRAKENADAAKRLGELEESQKSESQKAADRLRQAEEKATSLEFRATVAEVASASGVPVAILAGPTERSAEGIKAYAEQLQEWAGERKKNGNRVPREGQTPSPAEGSERQFAQELFSSGN
ncbi:hypothetical protein [uncultured Arthrobacter sp.]|uniref:hypothetical protein n=1 Tax=uncultured Arthrobacter sp. TaxID=114050 RepID=UPI0025F0211A|nr:hypothetical protein [uncultured Arthrobacter sp.]